MHSTKLGHFYPTPANLVVHTPITDCLAASNGICIKINVARFELLLFENEVNNNFHT